MPNDFNVTVTPSADGLSGSCSPFKAEPIGPNALLKFKFPAGTTGWSFVANSFAIKSTSPNQPGAGMFQVMNSSSAAQMVVQDQNGDGKLYSYLIKIQKGTAAPVTIDPDIQNDVET